MSNPSGKAHLPAISSFEWLIKCESVGPDVHKENTTRQCAQKKRVAAKFHVLHLYANEITATLVDKSIIDKVNV